MGQVRFGWMDGAVQRSASFHYLFHSRKGGLNCFWLSERKKHETAGRNINCQCFCTVADWIDTQYLPQNRSRLKAAHSYVTGELRSLDVPYLDRPAAMFVWADLRKVGQSCGDFSSHLPERRRNSVSLC